MREIVAIPRYFEPLAVDKLCSESLTEDSIAEACVSARYASGDGECAKHQLGADIWELCESIMLAIGGQTPSKCKATVSGADRMVFVMKELRLFGNLDLAVRAPGSVYRELTPGSIVRAAEENGKLDVVMAFLVALAELSEAVQAQAVQSFTLSAQILSDPEKFNNRAPREV
jgi:hypothetical protein